MADKIGIYVCECGTNVSEGVDVEQLEQFAQSLAHELSHPAMVKRHKLLCSEQGCQEIADDIRREGLDRVVVAGCSPKEHDETFRRACGAGGINPYMFQMANIRELAAWATVDKPRATTKAKAYLRAAVKRVREHEPLQDEQVEVVADALVVGAGVAGIEAALVLAQRGRNVFLIEKEPHIGGKVLECDEIFPTMECSSCMLEAKLDEVLHHERIRVLTLSELQSVLGYYGSFAVQVKKKARYVNTETCLGCAACYPACPVEAVNDFDEGLSKRKAIFVSHTGALPNVPVIDRDLCLHFSEPNSSSQPCTACRDACPFGDTDYIDFDDRDELLELKVGAIVVATGFSLHDDAALAQYGLGELPEVYTNMQLERLLSPNGPTSGQVLGRNGKPPRSLTIVTCAGRVGATAAGDDESGQAKVPYCSSFCCASSIKLARLLRHKAPDVAVTMVHGDWCLPGKVHQQFRDELNGSGVELLRVEDTAAVTVSAAGDGLLVRGPAAAGATHSVATDMVVLSVGMKPGIDTSQLARTLRVPVDEHGFFLEAHGRISPVSTPLEGVFVAGAAKGPADIQASTASGAAAAGKILSGLVPGQKLELGGIGAEIDPEVCGGCKTCIGVCAYQAITYDEDKKVAVVNRVLCQGCGTCAAACPAGAGNSRHFTAAQMLAEIEGVMG